MLTSLKATLLKRENSILSEALDEEILLGEDQDLDDIIEEENLSEGKTYTDADFDDIPEDDPNLGDDDLDELIDEASKADETIDIQELGDEYSESYFSDEGQSPEDPVSKEEETADDLMSDGEIDNMMEESSFVESLYESGDFLGYVFGEACKSPSVEETVEVDNGELEEESEQTANVEETEEFDEIQDEELTESLMIQGFMEL